MVNPFRRYLNLFKISIMLILYSYYLFLSKDIIKRVINFIMIYNLL